MSQRLALFATLAIDVENARFAFSDYTNLLTHPPPPPPAPPADGKGSRLLTANEHWKSQIRHALYTSPRFKRVDDGEAWSVSNPAAAAPAPISVRVYPGDDEAVAAQRMHDREEHKKEKAALRQHRDDTAVSAPSAPSARKRRISTVSSDGDDASDTPSPHRRSAKRRQPLAEVTEADQLAAMANPWRKRDDAGRLHRALRRAQADRTLPRLVSRDSSPEPDTEDEVRIWIITLAWFTSYADELYSSPFTFFFNQEKDKPVIVMVGNKAVVPKGRDAAHNRRKPTGGHRAAMPSGTNLNALGNLCGVGGCQATSGFIYHPSNEFITYHLGVSG